MKMMLDYDFEGEEHYICSASRTEPSWMHVKLHRIKGWFRRIGCIMRSMHTHIDSDWGYGMNGIVDRYCPNCLQIHSRVPLDDFEHSDQVFKALDTAREIDKELGL